MSNRLLEIFNAQRQLANRFLVIEKNNGLLRLEDKIEALELDSFHNQARLRGAAWRIIEECAELSIEEPYGKPELIKEVSDILHFLTEFSILSGVESHNIVEPELLDNDMDSMSYIFDISHVDLVFLFEGVWKDFVTQVGWAVNHLKNRPWKSSMKTTNKEEYRIQVKLCWYRFSDICQNLHISSEDLYRAYFHKNTENQLRIENGV